MFNVCFFLILVYKTNILFKLLNLLNLWVFVYVFFCMSLMSFIFTRKHILLCLMSLEFVDISLLFMIMYFFMFSYSLYLYVLFMTFFVCEGVLGLDVLVYMIRSYGTIILILSYDNILFLYYLLILFFLL